MPGSLSHYYGITNKNTMNVCANINGQNEMGDWYRCPDWNEAFVHNWSLKEHMENVHKKKNSIEMVEKQFINDMEEVHCMSKAGMVKNTKLTVNEGKSETESNQDLEMDCEESTEAGIEMEVENDGLADLMDENVSNIDSIVFEQKSVTKGRRTKTGGIPVVKLRRLQLTEDLLEQVNDLEAQSLLRREQCKNYYHCRP